MMVILVCILCVSLQLIFTGEYVRAMNENFHSGHFCCQQCDKALSGQSYILKEEKPFCVGCYDNNFANECAECNKKIGHDSKVLLEKDYMFNRDFFFNPPQLQICGYIKAAMTMISTHLEFNQTW